MRGVSQQSGQVSTHVQHSAPSNNTLWQQADSRAVTADQPSMKIKESGRNFYKISTTRTSFSRSTTGGFSMAKFRVFKSGGCWVAKQVDGDWTSGFVLTEHEAICRAEYQARCDSRSRIFILNEGGSEREVVRIRASSTPRRPSLKQRIH
jgi:hypothetical protein